MLVLGSAVALVDNIRWLRPVGLIPRVTRWITPLWIIHPTPFLFSACSSRVWSFILSLSLSSFMSLESLESLICWYRALLFLGFFLLCFRLPSALSSSLLFLSLVLFWSSSLLPMLPSSVGVLFRFRVCLFCFSCCTVSMFPYLVFLPLLPSLGCAFRLLLFVVSWSLVLSACGLVFWLCLSSESSVCSFVSCVAVFLVVLVLLLSSRVVLCSNVNPYDTHVACSLLSLSGFLWSLSRLARLALM